MSTNNSHRTLKSHPNEKPSVLKKIEKVVIKHSESGGVEKHQFREHSKKK
jgi:hypothetical protein